MEQLTLEYAEHLKNLVQQAEKADPQYEIFGASSHRYQLYPVLSVQAVEAYEAKYNIKLPSEYKFFITYVGNGGAGPDYGIDPLDLNQPRTQEMMELPLITSQLTQSQWEEALQQDTGDCLRGTYVSVRAVNNGTVPLSNCVLTDKLPPEVDITKLSLVSSDTVVPSYDLFVETSALPGTYQTVAENLSGDSGVYDLTDLIPVGHRVLSVRAVLDSMDTKNSSTILYLQGTVNETAKTDQVIVNAATMTADSTLGDFSTQSSATTKLNGTSILKIDKYLSPIRSAYYVKFLPFGDYTLTTQQAGAANGSKPDPETGLTAPFTLDENQIMTSVDAGLLLPRCEPPVIHAEDRCLHVGDPFDPLSGVTATDCQGNDITADVTVTANDVDPTVEGIYSVTYSVTDEKGQTTTKTIEVRVCAISPRHQAISDLFESVAAERR